MLNGIFNKLYKLHYQFLKHSESQMFWPSVNAEAYRKTSWSAVETYEFTTNLNTNGRNYGLQIQIETTAGFCHNLYKWSILFLNLKSIKEWTPVGNCSMLRDCLPCARHCPQRFSHILSLYPQTVPWNRMIVHLQMRKLSPRLFK